MTSFYTYVQASLLINTIQLLSHTRVSKKSWHANTKTFLWTHTLIHPQNATAREAWEVGHAVPVNLF